MARKIFVSYKHSDDEVTPLPDRRSTARAYVDYLIDKFKGDEIYKGEGNEDLSEFKNETIATHLKNKIYDSSITLVLISPRMKEQQQSESDQWIPWEIAYSLKEITRNDRTSQTNAVLAVTLPDRNDSYSYFIESDTCSYCHYCTLHTNMLFQILRDNMFNIRGPSYSDCPYHQSKTVYTGDPSYIHAVKWCNFVEDTEKYLKKSEDIRDKIEDYNITKIVSN